LHLTFATPKPLKRLAQKKRQKSWTYAPQAPPPPPPCKRTAALRISTAIPLVRLADAPDLPSLLALFAASEVSLAPSRASAPSAFGRRPWRSRASTSLYPMSATASRQHACSSQHRISYAADDATAFWRTSLAIPTYAGAGTVEPSFKPHSRTHGRATAIMCSCRVGERTHGCMPSTRNWALCPAFGSPTSLSVQQTTVHKS
jgi:hypothetical protein